MSSGILWIVRWDQLPWRELHVFVDKDNLKRLVLLGLPDRNLALREQSLAKA
jgi:hypothetical protein